MKPVPALTVPSHAIAGPTGPRASAASRGACASLVLAACFVLPGARAADAAAPVDGVVLVPAAIPFADPQAADDCDWPSTTPAYLASRSQGRVVVEGAGPAPARSRRLKLVTQNVHVIGGGPWTGPKWIVLEGTLTDGGRTIGSFEARRQTIAGSLSSCRTASALGEEIAGDILGWLDAPTANAKLGDAK